MLRVPDTHSCIAKQTFASLVALHFDEPQLSIDPHSFEVSPHTGKYCIKGVWHGRLDFTRFNAFIATFEHIIRLGSLLIVERISDEQYQYGICHGQGTVCSIPEFLPAFEAWSRRAGTVFPSLSVHDLEDLRQEVFVKTAEGLDEGKFIVYSPQGFPTTMARNLQINWWTREAKTASLSAEQAAAIPDKEIVSDVLEIADELAAAMNGVDLRAETLHSLRHEMVRLDPTGALLILGRWLQQHASPRIGQFFEIWRKNGGDPEATAVEFGIAAGSVRTYVQRVRAVLPKPQNEAA